MVMFKLRDEVMFKMRGLWSCSSLEMRVMLKMRG